MLVAALYALARLSFDLVMLLGRERARDQAELLSLRHQVCVLERQVKRVHWQPADRLILASLLHRLSPNAITGLLAQPATVLSWHRELVGRKWRAFGQRPRRGRPLLPAELRQLIVRLATENPTWGYLRIRGELLKLGHRVSAGTIKTCLRHPKVPPAPRRSSLAWRRFLAAHAATIVVTDFLTVDTVCLKRLYILFFMHLATRRILFAACTDHPDQAWITQQARHLAWEITELGIQLRFLIRDRDRKFCPSFDAVLVSEGAEIVRTPFRTPVANAFAERWVSSARHECLDWMLIIGVRHLERVFKVYVDHYNRARPHRALQLEPPTGPRAAVTPEGPLLVSRRLGGLLNDYSRLAA